MPKSTAKADQVRFAHPAEAVVARLLDAYHVRWLYEPTTFSLITSDSGLPLQCFTPDFFLPDHDVYIEMTTMRQALVTRKNRKFRLMRELYPEVDVRLLYRKDVELIVERYGIEHESNPLQLSEQFASAEHVHRKAIEVASRLDDSDDRPLLLIALGTGAERFRDAIAAEVAARGLRATTSSLSVPRTTKTSGLGTPVPAWSAPDEPGEFRRVLVTDIVSTGLTVNSALASLKSSGLPVAEVVTLLDRRTARLIEVPLLVPGISVPSVWFVGAGLGGKEFEGLDDLHTTEPAPDPLHTSYN